MKRDRAGWGLVWRSDNRLNGRTRYLIWDCGRPLLFNTRWEARHYRDEVYGYIRSRPDLQAEPHGWKIPAVVRATVTFETEEEV